MKNLFKSIGLNDFLPPIIGRISKKVKVTLNNSPQHPFDCIPKTISPLWYLDVGANVGDVTLKALRSYPQCKVICFEPVLETFGILSERLKNYGDRCTLFNMGLSDSNGETEINIVQFHKFYFLFFQLPDVRRPLMKLRLR